MNMDVAALFDAAAGVEPAKAVLEMAGVTPKSHPGLLYRMAELGNAQFIHEMVCAGWDPNGTQGRRGRPLYAALAHGGYEAVRALLDAGSSVVVKDVDFLEESVRRADAAPDTWRVLFSRGAPVTTDVVEVALRHGWRISFQEGDYMSLLERVPNSEISLYHLAEGGSIPAANVLADRGLPVTASWVITHAICHFRFELAEHLAYRARAYDARMGVWMGGFQPTQADEAAIRQFSHHGIEPDNRRFRFFEELRSSSPA